MKNEMRLANQYHQARKPVEAAIVCRQVLSKDANDLDALNLLGILEAQAGKLDDAIKLLYKSVESRPEIPLSWLNLGCVLVNAHRLDEALSAYQRVIDLSPADARAYHAAGLILTDLDRLDEAILSFARSTELNPHFPDSHFKLGILLRKQRRFDEAIAAYSKTIALSPDFPDAHNNLGNALRDVGRLNEAIVAYKKAIELKPADSIAKLNLGNALIDAERFAEAVDHLMDVTQREPTYFEAHNQLAFSLASLRRFDEAKQAHEMAVSLRPDDPRVYETWGVSLLLEHDVQAAEEYFRKALTLCPESASAWNGLGTALQALGQLDESLTCLEHAVRLQPDKAFFHKSLIEASRHHTKLSEIEKLQNLFSNQDSLESNRIDAGFALGKLFDDCERYDEAFGAYEKANTLLRDSRARSGIRFDGQKLYDLVDQLMDNFTPEFFAARTAWGNDSEVPVFIVGMPRSGTTLVEQVAASHPSVHGAGERQFIENAYAILGKRSEKHGRNWSAESISQAAADYLGRLQLLGRDCPRVIDKMPGNVFHLGLIATLFTKARVIFCRRDGRDTCLSCYFQQFSRKDDLPFKYDLADCGRQYLETERIIEHWRNVLPLRMLEVKYEHFVSDQDGQTRRLIEFLELPWDPKCLEFHRTKRVVMTASAWQVRQPLYARSVGRWKHYQQHLHPLNKILGTG